MTFSAIAALAGVRAAFGPMVLVDMVTNSAQIALRPAGRPCEVCTMPERERHAIEAAVFAAGRPYRRISRDFGGVVGPDSIRRHVRNHLAPEVEQAYAEAQSLRPLGIAARLVDIADSARDTRLAAEDEGLPWLALQAGLAESRTLAVVAERLGIEQGDVMANLRDADQLVDAIPYLARDEPEAAEGLARVLESRDRRDLAAAVRQSIAISRPLQEGAA